MKGELIAKGRKEEIRAQGSYEWKGMGLDALTVRVVCAWMDQCETNTDHALWV